MDLATRRKINKGFSDGFTRAIEIVATPVVLGGAGALVDAWLGSRPVATLAFAAFGVCGIAAKLWLGYDREMAVEEARLATGRRRGPVPNAAPAPVDMRLDPGIGARGGEGGVGRGADHRHVPRLDGAMGPARRGGG